MAAVNFYLPYRLAVKPTNVGAPGAQLFMYAPGGTTKRPMFTTNTLTTQHPNPLIADGAGKWPDVYLDNTLDYKYLIKDKAGATLDQMDPYIPGQAPDASELQPYADAAAASALEAATSAATALAAAAGLDPSDYYIITPQLYGAQANGTTNDSAAFVAAIAAAASAGVAGQGYAGGGVGSPRIYVPAGVYYLGTTTLELTNSVILEGDSIGESGGAASVLKWDVGTVGIRVQANNTSGATGIKSSVSNAGTGSIIRNLTLHGSYAGVNGNGHGIQLRARASICNVAIYNFDGNGIHIQASSGAGTASPYEGNVNCWEVSKAIVNGCYHGLYTNGADANAGYAIGLDVIGNRGYGIYEDSFLGNTYVAAHAGSNTLGCYYAGIGNANNRSAFFGHYVEGDQPGANFGSTVIAMPITQGTAPQAGTHYLNNSDYGPGVRDSTAYAQWAIDGYSNAYLNFLYRGALQSFLRNSNGEGLYYNVPLGSQHRFYADINNTAVHFADLDANGFGLISGSLGYRTGAGGAVTQATSKSTGVTLNKGSGQITMHNAALAAAAKVSFAVANSTVAATDTVIVSVASGGTASAYRAAVTAVAAGSFTITVENITAGSLSEAPVINFAIIKAVNA